VLLHKPGSARPDPAASWWRTFTPGRGAVPEAHSKWASLFFVLSATCRRTEGKRGPRPAATAYSSCVLRRVFRLCLLRRHRRLYGVPLPSLATAGIKDVLLHAFFLNGFDLPPSDPAWWYDRRGLVLRALPIVVPGAGTRAPPAVVWRLLSRLLPGAPSGSGPRLPRFRACPLGSAYLSLPVMMLWFSAGIGGANRGRAPGSRHLADLAEARAHGLIFRCRRAYTSCSTTYSGTLGSCVDGEKSKRKARF